MITYMPRKLPIHSDNLIFLLRNKLPKSWRLKPLHNLEEKDVYKYLLKSKIFLSFSDMEGLGMPPIEAAIAGNKIIGYCGQGGTEYWRKPIFTEIPHGNISKFIREIFSFLSQWIALRLLLSLKYHPKSGPRLPQSSPRAPKTSPYTELLQHTKGARRLQVECTYVHHHPKSQIFHSH